MGFENFSINKAEFNLYEQTNQPQFIQSDVILINKSHEGLFPTAYKLQYKDINFKDFWVWSTFDFSRLDSEAFHLLGEVDFIKREGHLIRLRNQNTIRYQFLVIVSDEEKNLQNRSLVECFISGLHVLADAIMTEKKVLLGNISKKNLTNFFWNDAQIKKEDQSEVLSISERIFHAKKLGSLTDHPSMDYSNRYFFEIDL